MLILNALHDSGIQCRLSPAGKVEVAGPLDNALRAAIRDQRATLAAALRAQSAWLADLADIRRPGNPDWARWPPGARREWARQMIEIAINGGFDALAPPEEWAWLAGQAAAALVAGEQPITPFEKPEER